MPEDRMDHQQPRADSGSKPKPAGSASPDTKMAHDTVTPEEHDPVWDALGATRISEGPLDTPSSGIQVDAPANFTELSPSRVLGKNLVKLGEFQLVKKLGEGAMGAVYKAQQLTRLGEKLDKPMTVAVKVLFPHVANNPKLIQRLRREGLAMFGLDHPNIVRSYAFDEEDGCFFVAMEYVSGQSMQKWLDQLGCVPVGDAVRVALDCALALRYAHGQNVVHRDIKPDNILLTRSGIVKVADLGMVKMDDEEMSLTQTGHAVGTPWYMPLEQARNSKEIDGRCDIYALGCTLYAMLTGHPPFVGRTIVDVIRAKEVGTFPPARQTNVTVPERLDLIIAKMTAKLPKNRYQTCDELIKDLENLGLANTTLEFIKQKPSPRDAETPSPELAKTNLLGSIAKSKADAELEAAAPSLDPDTWYVQMKMQDGSVVTRKYQTAQLHKMVSDGTISPTARAGHHPTEGFRALATYKEFQGTALSKMSKKAADKNTAKYRGVYKRLEEEEQRRAEMEREANKQETAMQANTRYWGSIALMVAPILLAAAGIIAFLCWLASQ